MALANYSDLQSAVASFANRTDLTSQIPDFIALAEARIARDLRLRGQIATTTLTTVANTRTVALPSDWLETENITINTSPPRTLAVITPELMDVKYPSTLAASPAAFTVIGGNLALGPIPDAAYDISLDYYQRIPALSTQSTNFLLTAYPMVFLSGALVELHNFIGDDQGAARWESRYQREVQTAQAMDDTSLRSGATMRVRTV